MTTERPCLGGCAAATRHADLVARISSIACLTRASAPLRLDSLIPRNAHAMPASAERIARTFARLLASYHAQAGDQNAGMLLSNWPLCIRDPTGE